MSCPPTGPVRRPQPSAAWPPRAEPGLDHFTAPAACRDLAVTRSSRRGSGSAAGPVKAPPDLGSLRSITKTTRVLQAGEPHRAERGSASCGWREDQPRTARSTRPPLVLAVLWIGDQLPPQNACGTQAVYGTILECASSRVPGLQQPMQLRGTPRPAVAAVRPGARGARKEAPPAQGRSATAIVGTSPRGPGNAFLAVFRLPRRSSSHQQPLEKTCKSATTQVRCASEAGHALWRPSQYKGQAWRKST